MLYNAFSLNTFGYHILITTKLEIPSYYEIDLGNWISHNIEGIQKLPTRKLKLGKHENVFTLLHIMHKIFLLLVETEKCKYVMINSKLLKLIVPDFFEAVIKFILAT